MSTQPEYTDEVADKFYDQFEGVGYGGSSTTEAYSKWSDRYEYENLNMRYGYQHPVKIAEVANRVISNKTGRVLDLCAGTGLGGQALKDRGFTNIDALDGSAGMLEKARKKDIYKNIYHELVGETKIKSVEPGSFDAIVSSGSFVPGHLGPKQLRPIADLLKPGGIFCMAMRMAFLDSGYLSDLEPEMKRMQEEGIWKPVERSVMPNYHNHFDGVIFVFERC